MGGPVDYEAMKLQQQAMNATVLERAKKHPAKPMKAWKLFLIIGVIFALMIAFVLFLNSNLMDELISRMKPLP
jgi:capsular polysaccharide biosynthesis protein